MRRRVLKREKGVLRKREGNRGTDCSTMGGNNAQITHSWGTSRTKAGCNGKRGSSDKDGWWKLNK